MPIYRVNTSHGTHLQADLSTGWISHSASVSPGFVSLACWVPTDRPTFCFLIPEAALSAPLLLPHDQERCQFISLRLHELHDGTATFCNPRSEQYLCAEVTGAQIGSVVLNRREVGPWETFSLTPVESVPSHVIAEIEGLTETIRIVRDGPSALAYLQSGAPAANAGRLSSVLRLLQPHDLAWLGRQLARTPSAVSALAQALPNDVWAAEALPALLRHQRGELSPFPRHVGEHHDFLASAGIGGSYVSAAQCCNSFARRTVAPRRGICVMATARNEGLYLLEWLAYHRAIGVEAFFIYTNNNDDGSDALLSALSAAGLINLITNSVGPGSSPQYKAYGHAFQILPELLDYAWVATIDIDEFIALDTTRFRSLPAFLESMSYQRMDAIALNWLMYPANDQIARAAEPVTHRFIWREPGINPHVKTICRPAMFVHSHCHFPIWDEQTVFAFLKSDGRAHRQKIDDAASAFAWEPTDQGAWVNHYHTKSAQEFVVRRTTGRGDFALQATLDAGTLTEAFARYVRAWFQSPELLKDDRAKACAPNLLNDIAELRRLPGVNDALETVEGNYQALWVAILALLQADPRFAIPGSHEQWLLDLVLRRAPAGEVQTA